MVKRKSVEMIFIILTMILLFLVATYLSARARVKEIYRKYGETEDTERILKKIIWVGETSEQLIDSLGPPLDVDKSVLKTKIKEVWKYYRTGANRYALKVKLENNFIVGWDKK